MKMKSWEEEEDKEGRKKKKEDEEGVKELLPFLA